MTEKMDAIELKAYIHAKHNLKTHQIRNEANAMHRDAEIKLAELNEILAEAEGYAKAYRERIEKEKSGVRIGVPSIKGTIGEAQKI